MQPSRTLNRWNNFRQDTIHGLSQINSSALPGKLKLWMFQFCLPPHLMRPITIYKLSLSHAKRLERVVNVQQRKWLWLPGSLSGVGLYRNGALSLPISSLVEEYKCAKAQLEMTLTGTSHCSHPGSKEEVETAGCSGRCPQTPRHCGSGPTWQRRAWVRNNNTHMANGYSSRTTEHTAQHTLTKACLTVCCRSTKKSGVVHCHAWVCQCLGERRFLYHKTFCAELLF